MINAVALGQVGSTLITSTSAVTGKFIGFLCLTDTTLTSIKAQLSGDSYSGVTFPKGAYIPLPFESITLATGSVLAVRAASQTVTNP
jgi:hypothetical protein